MRDIELLAPAGSFDALTAAVESGADAVYLGGSKFNARIYANNFDNEILKKAVEYAHIRGVKVYITLNTLIADREIHEVLEYIGFLYSIDVDALIIQDVSVIKLIRDFYPDFELHCSTQMTLHNTEGAVFFEKLGIKRVVLARELSIQQIKRISENSKVKLEAFVHGALCVSYSGQCLMSSMIGGRSGNRGTCAQPCRKKYSFYDISDNKQLKALSGKHLLSTRDLNTYYRLDELIDSGVYSFKIEGRMKKPEYVATVVKNYKAKIDGIINNPNNYTSDNPDYELEAVFNREFTEGYLFNNRNKSIVSIERPDNRGVYIGNVIEKQGDFLVISVEENYLHNGDSIEITNKNRKTTGTTINGMKINNSTVQIAEKNSKVKVFFRDYADIGAVVRKTIDSKLQEKALKEYALSNSKKIHINGRVILRTGKAPELQISDADKHFIAYKTSDLIEKAHKIATTEDRVYSQIHKTGDTPYVFDALKIEMDSDCNIPVRVLNELRRGAFELLNKERSNINRRKPVIIDNNIISKRYYDGNFKKNYELETIACIDSCDMAEAAAAGNADIIYVRYNWNLSVNIINRIIDICRKYSIRCYLLLPSITKDTDLDYLESNIFNNIKEWNGVGIVISNIGQLSLARKYAYNNIRLNNTFNIFNSIGANFYKELDVENIALSQELNLIQIKEISRNCDIRFEGMVYGYLPVMTLEYCPLSLIDECKACDKSNYSYGLQDEKGKVFTVIKEGFCRSKILNSDRLYVLDELNSIISSGVKSLRADFYDESNIEITLIMNLLSGKYKLSDKDMQIVEKLKAKGYTKGHYHRGVV